VTEIMKTNIRTLCRREQSGLFIVIVTVVCEGTRTPIYNVKTLILPNPIRERKTARNHSVIRCCFMKNLGV
jgi:hypothetical protein